MDNDDSQTPELSLSDSSTGRVRQGERGAAELQGTAVLQGMRVHMQPCKALTKDCNAQLYTYKSHVKQ